MRKTIQASLFALLLVPSLAAAAAVPMPATAPSDNVGCDPGLSFLDAAPFTPATGGLALAPQANAKQQVGRACCKGRRIACEAICAPCGGVFEFNCDPATCQSNCICNICP
jgi:hypothetical protein